MLELRATKKSRLTGSSLPTRLLQALPLGQQSDGILGPLIAVVGSSSGNSSRSGSGHLDGLEDTLDQPRVDIDLYNSARNQPSFSSTEFSLV
jgi:hypothetical protein